MKHLKYGGPSILEEPNKSATIDPSSESDQLEQNDEIRDLIDFEKANQIDTGFNSNRHFLGKQDYRPHLLSDQEFKMYEQHNQE